MPLRASAYARSFTGVRDGQAAMGVQRSSSDRSGTSLPKPSDSHSAGRPRHCSGLELGSVGLRFQAVFGQQQHAAAGGTFTITNGEPSTLDPAIDWEQPGWAVLHTLYQTLYDYAPAPGAAGQKLEPILAAAMPTISSDGLTYTIPLRKGVRFAPPIGRELTANDIRFSFERMLRTPQAPGTSFYENIVGVPDFVAGKGAHVSGFPIVDPSTIEIHLARPDPTLLYTLAMEFCGVMPPEWATKWGAKISRHPLGSGPFMLDHWTAGTAIVVKRNPNYRDADRVWLDTIKFEAAYGSERDLMRVQRDELDCTYLTHATWLWVKNDPQLKKGLQMEVWPAMDYLVLNTQMKPLDNVRVRQALSCDRPREDRALRRRHAPLPNLPARCPG